MKRGNIKKFGRVKNKREAFHKALSTALIDFGRIHTTVTRAKVTSQYVDKLITKAKKGDLASRRVLGQNIGDTAVKKLIHDVAPKFKDKRGGYTRVLKLGRRTSDGAEMAIVEFTA